MSARLSDPFSRVVLTLLLQLNFQVLVKNSFYTSLLGAFLVLSPLLSSPLSLCVCLCLSPLRRGVGGGGGAAVVAVDTFIACGKDAR